MNDHPPSLLIQYDPTTWKPTAIFYNGATDTETALLQEVIAPMLRNIESPKRPEDEN